MKNIVFCGVGGQGVILASKVLMQVAMNAGYDVKESEHMNPTVDVCQITPQ